MTSGNSVCSVVNAAASISTTATFAPAAEKARAISRPMPDAPAVINTLCMRAIVHVYSYADSTMHEL
jgi:hypothetical protein